MYCYILKNQDYPNQTYVGSTNNITRRLRQHNQEISGGAKATKKSRTWEIYALLSGFSDMQNMLQCEWRIRHQKYYGVKGRIKSLNETLKLEQWTKNSKIKNSELDLTVKIQAEYLDLLKDLPGNVKIINL